MEKAQSLAEFLGTNDSAALVDVQPRLEDITDSKEFALAVLASREFRSYIVNSLLLGSLPAAVVIRMMDYGWGKPPDRVEHTGKDGNPIETVTEVRRTIVHVNVEAQDEPSYVTH